MDSTPRSKIRKLSCKKNNSEQDSEETQTWSSSQLYTDTSHIGTPPSNKNRQQEQTGDSPVYFPLTQDGNEDIDVVWDWNSPQTHETKRKKSRRLPPPPSPIVPTKRPMCNQNLKNLEEELKALREQLATSFDETLHVSPQHEDEILQSQNKYVLEDRELEHMFDDSLDDQLLLFTQKIESEMTAEKQNQGVEASFFDELDISAIINKNKEDDKKSGQVEESKAIVNVIKKQTKNGSFQRTYSNEQYPASSNNKMQNKVEFNRTKSFEEPNTNSSQLPKNVLEQIEQKRREALARLEAKRSKSISSGSSNLTSIVECSGEEIEKKRLQALAKREVSSSTNTNRQNFTLGSTSVFWPTNNKYISQKTNYDSGITVNRQSQLNQEEIKMPSISHNFSKQVTSVESSCTKKCSPEEIEKKRLEALAKRDALSSNKNLQISTSILCNNVNLTLSTNHKDSASKLHAPLQVSTAKSNISTGLGSMKCSPEEIEKKRLQALAKREEKKVQELIERKRQEALKRLQLNKQKFTKPV